MICESSIEPAQDSKQETSLRDPGEWARPGNLAGDFQNRVDAAQKFAVGQEKENFAGVRAGADLLDDPGRLHGNRLISERFQPAAESARQIAARAACAVIKQPAAGGNICDFCYF